MEYLEEFQDLLNKDDFVAFIHMWEEYCTNDLVDGLELRSVLEIIKSSNLSVQFGPYAETSLTPWKMIEDQNLAHEVLRLIIDLETSNSQDLALFVYQYLSVLYKDHKYFNEKIRLIGLRKGENFQGAIRNYELLTHLNKGNFVFHTGGWGAGEIIEVSLVREQLVLEFENVVGRKDLPFEQAFKNLVPIPKDHFLARRFGSPDLLEEDARKNPLEIIHLLLRDIGPKTALEIKEELYELVLPAEEWSKWWQTARSKLKKDTLVEVPPNAREPFRLRRTEVSHKELLIKKIKNSPPSMFIQALYNFLRDFSENLKDPEFKTFIKEQLLERLSYEVLTESEKMQISLLIQENFGNEIDSDFMKNTISEIEHLQDAVNEITISGLKKRALITIKSLLEDWKEFFSDLLFDVSPNSLKDYIFEELYSSDKKDLVEARLLLLLKNYTVYPEAFVWYFQKVFSKEDVPFNDEKKRSSFFENFLVLLGRLEKDPLNKTLAKKMYGLICQGRYSLVRKVLKDSEETFAKEFLLLITKCNCLTKQDISVLKSLVQVEHPDLVEKDFAEEKEEEVVWTTQEGFDRIKEKIKHIATVETVENAKEIEAARALGDLRENSEYKFSLEKRSQLQAQIKLFSDQLNQARVITPDDVLTSEAGVGSVITIEDDSGSELTYTILGPWDADVDKNILSFQSKLAQAMMGFKIGDRFVFKDKEYGVKNISSYLDN